MREHKMVTGSRTLLVAVSGGPDSVCLLHILAGLRDELGVGLHVAHLDHQLRGAESEADAGYVSDLARRLGIPATVEQRDVKGYKARRHLSMEEAAREVRYNFLAEVARSVGANRVVVGHTTDDHVETILMHLIRGTGIRGLHGLQPVSRWQSPGGSLTVIRPLLQVSRQETAGYCRRHQLMPRTDTSNLSLSPLRNRIRHQFLPLLEGYNPRVAEALLRTARIADDALEFIDGESARLWGELGRGHENTVVLDREKFLKVPQALQRHLLRMSIEDLLGNLKDIETRHIEEIMDALDKPAGRRVTLPGGLFFSIEYDRYLLGSDPSALSPFPTLDGEFPLEVPGETLLHGWRVEAALISHEQMPMEEDDLTAYFDPIESGDSLLVRPRRPGDRFQPLGMSQPKKLGEFMIDAKIPRAWRQRVPIVCSPQHILWVVGWRIDDRVKVGATADRVIRLRFERR
jgi:tRNA(Ile)-lysidine synthase